MRGQTNKAIYQGNLQRALRRNMTDAERKLWNLLRGRQMIGLKFRRQHPFEDFMLDFVCLEKQLVIEVDGGQHQEQRAEDGIRTKLPEKAGFRVLRFWNHEVLQKFEAVSEKILQEVIKNDPSSPHPSP
ncbi:MAG: endonuclease domain-containing protein [Betaproteobacteria bacterium]